MCDIYVIFILHFCQLSSKKQKEIQTVEAFVHFDWCWKEDIKSRRNICALWLLLYLHLLISYMTTGNEL